VTGWSSRQVVSIEVRWRDEFASHPLRIIKDMLCVPYAKSIHNNIEHKITK